MDMKQLQVVSWTTKHGEYDAVAHTGVQTCMCCVDEVAAEAANDGGHITGIEAFCADDQYHIGLLIDEYASYNGIKSWTIQDAQNLASYLIDVGEEPWAVKEVTCTLLEKYSSDMANNLCRKAGGENR